MSLPELHHLEPLLQVLASLSLFTFCISLLVIPLLVARLPKDFFTPGRSSQSRIHSATYLPQILVLAARNILGLILLAAGIAMLFLPGQGVVTIVIGLTVMSFPYKQRLLCTLTRPQTVRKSLDWVRRKVKKEQFTW
jgi:hypothetical protein